MGHIPIAQLSGTITVPFCPESSLSVVENKDFIMGFCYTQLTDIEQEQNGLYFYDRTPKFDAQWMHAVTSRKAAIKD